MISLKELKALQDQVQELVAAVEKDYKLILEQVPEDKRAYTKFLLEMTEVNNVKIGKITGKVIDMMFDDAMKGSIFREE